MFKNLILIQNKFGPDLIFVNLNIPLLVLTIRLASD